MNPKILLSLGDRWDFRVFCKVQRRPVTLLLSFPLPAIVRLVALPPPPPPFQASCFPIYASFAHSKIFYYSSSVNSLETPSTESPCHGISEELSLYSFQLNCPLLFKRQFVCKEVMTRGKKKWSGSSWGRENDDKETRALLALALLQSAASRSRR